MHVKKRSDFVIPVIDLFAGPGGLSEGFESFTKRGQSAFRCAMSIEKDRNAHQTLLLRTFLRQFKRGIPKEYYAFLRGEMTLKSLYDRFPVEHEDAAARAIRLTLGQQNRRKIDRHIARALKGKRRLWVLLGGPPCQAYSLAGRAKIRSHKGDAFDRDKRHFLYKEYLHIVKTFKPAIFVMENVKGLLSSTIRSPDTRRKHQKKGDTFDRILRDFSAAGYSVCSFVTAEPSDSLLPTNYVISAEKHGIPQARHRVILLGIRNGIQRGTDVLAESPSVPIEQAIGDLPKVRSQVSPKSKDSFDVWATELHRLRSLFPRTRRTPKTIKFRDLGTGAPHIEGANSKRRMTTWLRKHNSWFFDRRLSGITLHETRAHMPSDLRRYLFAAVYADGKGKSPNLFDFKRWQRPSHRNISRIDGAPFIDRFRVQVRGRPSTTIVSHISKDGHYYIHYDPRQCRSLTVREAARLQTFPDNYQFLGTRTAQYHQVGNAVPPLLARQMAEIVHGILRARYPRLTI